MATNLDIDQELLQQALDISQLKTKKATVNQALKEFVNSRKQKEIRQLYGSIDFDPDYDHKKHR